MNPTKALGTFPQILEIETKTLYEKGIILEKNGATMLILLS